MVAPARMSARIAVTGSLLALAWLAPGRAEAFERQWHLGGGAGVGSFMSQEKPIAPVLGAHLLYGASDMFDVGVELHASNHDVSGPDSNQRTWVYSVAPGATYKLDILSWVPYAGLFAGLYVFDGPSPVGRDFDFGASITMGLDYTVTRSFGVGFQARFHFFITDQFPSGFDDSALFTGLLRAEYRWGY